MSAAMGSIAIGRPPDPARSQEWVTAGGALGHLEVSFRTGQQGLVPQPTTKVTDCSDDPQALAVVLTRMAYLADKTPPFGGGP